MRKAPVITHKRFVLCQEYCVALVYRTAKPAYCALCSPRNGWMHGGDADLPVGPKKRRGGKRPWAD